MKKEEVVKTSRTAPNYLATIVGVLALLPAAAVLSPSASAQPNRCPAPSGSSTAAVIGCSCNWGSDPTRTAGGANAYCQHVVGVDVPVGFWSYQDTPIFLPPGPLDFNMFVCQSQTNRSPDECAVYLTQPSYAGNGTPHY